MATPSADGIAGRSDSEPVGDAAKLVIEHPLPLYDPLWLRLLHKCCLWDGGARTTGSEFCCARCEELYADWQHRTAHVLLGREPLVSFLERDRGLPR